MPGEYFACPECQVLCGVHDTIEKRWRHLNFFQYRCELVAKVPRTWCRTDGVHQVPVPWAREGSGFTLLMEALVMFLSAEMPVDGMADLLHETDTRLWRVLIYYVQQAQARRDWMRTSSRQTLTFKGWTQTSLIIEAPFLTDPFQAL